MSWSVEEQVLAGLLFDCTVMILLWLIQRKTTNAGIVDAGWAASIGIMGLLFAVTSDGYAGRRILVSILIGFWSARLALYILLDRVIGHPEEGRYQTLRKKWGTSAQRQLFIFFQIQALASLFFAVPILIIAHNRTDYWTPSDSVGILIWGFSVGNTVLADRQLARFKRRPENRGKTCRDGWWRYSRHPNYFFEWLHWWSYVPLAIGAPYGWATIAAPLLMLYFLLRVTGVPLAEAQALVSRGDDYRDYQQSTSKFIPWFPKSVG